MHRFSLSGDGTGDIINYAKAIAAVVEAREKSKPILGHCAAGTQRTDGVIVCYRVLIKKRLPLFAYKKLLRYDWDTKKNQILLRFINNNMTKLATILKQIGVIEEIPEPLPFIHKKYQSNKTS